MRKDDPNWRPISGYEGIYIVSRAGVIMRQNASGSWVEKKASVGKAGYKRTVLYRDGKSKTFFIHFLVLSSFGKDMRDSGLVCNHKNGVKTDNNLENLEWVTPRQNSEHAIQTGLYRYDFKGDDHYNSKLTSDKVLQIRRVVASNKQAIPDVAKTYGVAISTIYDIVKRRTWAHI